MYKQFAYLYFSDFNLMSIFLTYTCIIFTTREITAPSISYCLVTLVAVSIYSEQLLQDEKSLTEIQFVKKG